MHNLEIFDAEKQETHGGSMSVYVCKKGIKQKTERLSKYFEEEKLKNIESILPYTEFSKRVEESKESLIKLLKELKLILVTILNF